MNEAVQKAVQQRDEAVQVRAAATGDHRDIGKRAILASSRSAVFDRPSAAVAPVDPAVAISDPIWDHRALTAWTPDLVHCRLLVCGEILARLPPVVRRGYVSQLGGLALAGAASAHIAPSAAEITLADWTLEQISAQPLRQILLASVAGFSGDKIAEALRKRGMKIGGTTVQRHYIKARRQLAAKWQAAKVPVDALSAGRWHHIFDRQK